MLVVVVHRCHRCGRNCLYVAVGGVFAFDDLNLSMSAVCEVFNWFVLRVKGEANRPDEVWLVVFEFMLRV